MILWWVKVACFPYLPRCLYTEYLLYNLTTKKLALIITRSFNFTLTDPRRTGVGATGQTEPGERQNFRLLHASIQKPRVRSQGTHKEPDRRHQLGLCQHSASSATVGVLHRGTQHRGELEHRPEAPGFHSRKRVGGEPPERSRHCNPDDF